MVMVTGAAARCWKNAFHAFGSAIFFWGGGGPRHPAWTSQLRCSLGQAPPDMVPSAPQAKNPSYAPGIGHVKVHLKLSVYTLQRE